MANLTIGRRDFLAGMLGTGTLASAQTRRPPNIILILTDDQGWWDVGLHGNKDIDTPVMDRLAKESVEFTHFYVSPVCAPTRASLMTGRHYLRTGIYNTRFGGDTMHADEITIAQVLQKAGYHTGIFGKWHLGPHHPYTPHERGFDDALTFASGHVERLYYPDQLAYNGRHIEARGYITDILTDSAIAFVRQNRERPFFLYLAYNVPHEPHIIDDKHFEKYLKKGLSIDEARLYGMVTRCDENIGQVLAALDAEKLRDDTVVFFMSDNGGISKHFKAGLRGNKGSAWEGGVRVPFYARWPGKFPAGARTDSMGCHIDLFPTICEIAGASLPRPDIDGKSLLPMLRQGSGKSPHEYVFHIWDRFRPTLNSNWSISDGKYKLVKKELFDLENDPGESRNIAAANPQIAAHLKETFVAWLADVTRGQKFQPAAIQVGRADENPVEMQASWAVIDGTEASVTHPYSHPTHPPTAQPTTIDGATINYTFAAYEWDTIDGWKKPGEAATWRIDVVAEGDYEVTSGLRMRSARCWRKVSHRGRGRAVGR